MDTYCIGFMYYSVFTHLDIIIRVQATKLLEPIVFLFVSIIIILCLTYNRLITFSENLHDQRGLS